MESVYEEKSRFKFTKRKALVIAISIFAVGIIVSEPVYANAPWWVTTIGIVTGGIVGSLTGSPIGTIAGAEGGAMLADYIYNSLQKTSTMSGYSTSQFCLEVHFASTYLNMTGQELNDAEHSDNTSIELTSEDYYYNAQAEEAVVPYFLNESSLSCFNISLASGSYATLNNISLDMYSPIDTVLYQTWYTGLTDNNPGFNTSAMPFYASGTTLGSGNYIFIESQNSSTSVFRTTSGLAYLNLTNYYTGKTYNTTSYGVLPFDFANVPTGLYKVNKASDLVEAGIQILPSGALDTTYTAFNPSTDKCYGGFRVGTNSSWVLSVGSTFVCTYTLTHYTGHFNKPTYEAYPSFSSPPNYYTDLQTDLNKYFTSASTYFATLRADGYRSINQLPPNLVIPFPSDVVPSSMLNGTFTQQELEEMYIAYLNDLNNTFHNSTLYNGKNFTRYVNQTLFVNGFLTEYGDLCYEVGTTKTWLNNTDFFIQTYTHDLEFADHETTNLTGETYPVLVLNGSENGTLLYVDASIYVINLQLAGKDISSYDLKPVEITYVLPKTTSITVPQYPFILDSSLTEYLVIAVLVIVVLSAVVIGMAKKGHKDKKKRSN